MLITKVRIMVNVMVTIPMSKRSGMMLLCQIFIRCGTFNKETISLTALSHSMACHTCTRECVAIGQLGESSCVDSDACH